MKNVAPLDTVTSQLVRDVIADAYRTGRDPAEALHRHNLILSPAKRHLLKMIVLQEFAALLHGWRPAEYLRRVTKVRAPTPVDMYEAILGYVDDYVKEADGE